MAEYINREALIDAIERIDWFHTNENGVLVEGGRSDMDTYLPTDAVNEAIRSIPAADVVERKKGRWKQVHVGGFTPGGNCLSVCSECGWEFGTHRIYPDYNYCPNCGAKMEGYR